MVLLFILLSAVSHSEDKGAGSIGCAFSLKDQSERMFSTSELGKEKLGLVFFGYSQCKSMCPNTLHAMHAKLSKLDPEHKKFIPIFITLDPETDTPQVLKEFDKQFDGSFEMLTGEPAEIEALAKKFLVFSSKNDKAGEDEEKINHSGLIYLINGKSEYLRHYTASSIDELDNAP